MKKIIALLLIFSVILTLSACKSAQDEDEATAGDIVSDAGGETDANADAGQQDSGADDVNKVPDTDTTPDTETTKNPTSDKEQNSTPTLSTKGKYTVTFDYGYDNRKESEKTDGKITEITPERAGYEFAGWFDGAGKWDFSKEVAANLTLKAKWNIITYTITCNLGGATAEKSIPTSYTVDDEISLGSATKLGKVFVGWEIKNAETTYSGESISKGTTGNITIRPLWDETLVAFGKYERDNNSENGKEDIIWIKVKEENGKTLLAAKEIIDAKPYDTVGGAAVNWSNCSLRTWLGGEFYKNAFTAEEKAIIAETTNVTKDSHGEFTSKDFVFTLSVPEAQDILAAYTKRYAKVTPYAMANGAIEGEKGGWWWVRNKTSDYSAALCMDDGIFNDVTGYNTKLTTIGVRPFIWVDSSKL